MVVVVVAVGAVSRTDSVCVDVVIVVVVGRPGCVIMLVGMYVEVTMLCNERNVSEV